MLHRCGKIISVEGTVAIDTYDLDGSVLSVRLETDLGKYLIYDNSIGEQLLRSIGRSVWVNGIVWTEPGLEVLEISKFKFL